MCPQQNSWWKGKPTLPGGPFAARQPPARQTSAGLPPPAALRRGHPPLARPPEQPAPVAAMSSSAMPQPCIVGACRQAALVLQPTLEIMTWPGQGECTCMFCGPSQGAHTGVWLTLTFRGNLTSSHCTGSPERVYKGARLQCSLGQGGRRQQRGVGAPQALLRVHERQRPVRLLQPLSRLPQSSRE